MSMNQFYPELPEAQWWSRYAAMDHSPPAKTSSSHHKPLPTTASHNSSAATMLFSRSSAAAFDLNNDDDDDEEHASSTAEIPKERLFEKPLTPSDVGKLNRLVIPKQHAEKHFPISGGADSGESGLLLGFEDELGKSWRFRYSYWNSSQSYVLTKGWSRFVKEKRLESGDVIVFSRHRVDASRHFIGWRRRSSNGNSTPPTPPLANGGAAAWSRMVYSGHRYPIQQLPPPNSLHFRSESVHAGTEACLQQRQQTGSGNSKTLRLFGVNLECQADDESEPSTPVGSPMSTHPHHYSSNNHMDINFSAADLYRQR